MKTLYPAQQTALDHFIDAQKRNLSTLDSSVVGTGKTVVAAHLALKLFRNVAVICPKAVVTNWERELAEHGIKPIFVLNYEKIRTGRTPFLTKVGKKIMRWRLPQNTLLIFDEVQKCKGPFTQNTQLLISAKQCCLRIHMLSATACEDPTEMRGIGYALQLHDLNRGDRRFPGWTGWMEVSGCKQDHWGAWYLSNREKLKDVRDKIYN